MNANNDNLWLAMLALASGPSPAVEDVVDNLRRGWPEIGKIEATESSPQLATIIIGEAIAALTQIPAPIPWSELAGPAEAAWYWPEAGAALRDHESHVLIALLDESRGAVAKSTRLTQVTAAAAAAARAPAGIYWGPGRLVHNPDDFLDVANNMNPQDLPLYLWIDFRVGQNADGSLTLFTTGMEPLGHRELEVAIFSGPPQRLVESAYNVAHYILESKGTIRDGHTIGLADGMEITARIAASMCDPDLEVLRLDFTSEGASR
jgi:hypothetical protein